jgi:hypothetical protein
MIYKDLDITYCVSTTCPTIAKCDRHHTNTNFPPNSIVSMADFSEGQDLAESLASPRPPCKDFLKPEKKAMVTLLDAFSGRRQVKVVTCDKCDKCGNEYASGAMCSKCYGENYVKGN